jgi:hypothetical protein
LTWHQKNIVNAVSASYVTGTVAVGLSKSTRKRMLTICGMKSTGKIAMSLKPYPVKNDNEELHNFISRFQNTMNPFELEQGDNLNCLTTWMKVADDSRDVLVGCIDNGKTCGDEYLNGCIQDAARFAKIRSIASVM